MTSDQLINELKRRQHLDEARATRLEREVLL